MQRVCGLRIRELWRRQRLQLVSRGCEDSERARRTVHAHPFEIPTTNARTRPRTPLCARYDLIFSRDALQHKLKDNWRILSTFARSDAKYLLLSSYPGTTRNLNVAPGQYWPNNLAAPPFLLIPKRNLSEEFEGKYLYLYDRAALAEELVRRGKLSRLGGGESLVSA